MGEAPAAPPAAAPGAPEEHGTRLRNNALNLVGNVGLALGLGMATGWVVKRDFTHRRGLFKSDLLK